uniref:Structural maintenance of chromosomes protein 6 n=1 Tax=Xenopus tropicalis TaxID=8364 RepID=A0A6I8PMA1_XENTR
MGKRKEGSPIAPNSQRKKERQEAEGTYDYEGDNVQAGPSVSNDCAHHREPRDEANNSHTDRNYGNSVSCDSQSCTGEVGIIESISLRNFMCHSMLGPFRFGPNVNFVVGNNGSGKSAILTALIVGLGGKAAFTNRGSTIKGFIKGGENFAEISITLRNRGQDAYKPDVFGNSITVRQRITTEGGRTYKLKSATGAVISNKKEELTMILDHFNIQVDNPVSVLTQEMSKLFLQSKNESDKYKFFMKATQLEQMKEDYSYIMETKSKTHDQVKIGSERLCDLRQDCIQKEESFNSIASLGEMKMNLDNLKNSMAWALVIEAEKQIKPIRDQIVTEEGHTVKYEQRIDECQGKVNIAEEKFRAKQEELDKITQEAAELKPKVIALKDDVQKKRKSYNDAEASYNRQIMELKRSEKDAEQLSKRIEELKKRDGNASEREKMARQQEIAQITERKEELQNHDITISQKIKQLQEAIEKHKEKWIRIENEEQNVKQRLEQHKRQLRELHESKTDRLKRFGKNIPSLLAAIDEAYNLGRFRKKPFGPLGAYIHLKDQELALAVECCLKGLLFAFCCDNHQDEGILQNIMSKQYSQGRRPQIIVSEFWNNVYDVSQRASFHPNHPTVLTALEIDHPVVANCLIDMRGIETILIIKDKTEAREIMQKRVPPRNCREAFTGEGDQVYTNRYYSSDTRRATLLSRDVEAEISHLEEELRDFGGQVATLQQSVHSVDKDIKENEDNLRKYYNSKKQIQTELRTLSEQIAELENVEEQPSTDIATLEKEAAENTEIIELVRKEVELANENMGCLKLLLTMTESNYEEIKRKIISVSEVAEPVKEDLHRIDQEVENCKRHKKHYEDKLKEHLDHIQKRKEEVAGKEQELEVKISQAKCICPERIEVSRTARSLDTEINRLREKINSEEVLHGNREEIIKQYYEAKERYQDAARKIKHLKRFITLLDTIMEQRHECFQKFRRSLTLRCKCYFIWLLSQRAYSGKISFDHKNETLSITVQPGDGNKAELSDMRCLSGGERSFSTVCFILSLWSIAESPFRCLDEFDVYMDMVNRRISMDMMLSMADSQRFRQFILLTPQNMSSLPSTSLIRILRMKDPERGQTTLPFRPVDQQEEDED